MVYMYGPCAARVKHKFASRITKKAFLEVTVIIAGFLCFDQSDFSCKISLILQSKKFNIR